MKMAYKNKLYDLELIEMVEWIKSSWGEWSCKLESDSETIEGTIQSDGHMFAPETFEEN